MNGKIFIIEDETSIIQLVQHNLKKNGFVVSSSENGNDDEGFESAFSGANANAPVVEVTKDNFDQVCPKSNKLCVIALLDGKQSSKEKYEAVQELLNERPQKTLTE